MLRQLVRLCPFAFVVASCSSYVATGAPDAPAEPSSGTSSGVAAATSSGQAAEVLGRCTHDDDGGQWAYPDGLDGEGFRCVGACETAHGRVWCTGLDPFGPATEADLRPGETALSALELGRPYATSPVLGTWLDPSTGRIVERRAGGEGLAAEEIEIRPANADPRVEAVHRGIAFRILSDGRAMWRVRDLSLYEGVSFLGDVATLPVTLLAEQTVSVRGRVRWPCSGPDAPASELDGGNGQRSGSTFGSVGVLAGGGGHASPGGASLSTFDTSKRTPGGLASSWADDRLPLGGRGGAPHGGHGSNAPLPGDDHARGGGGAALQLVAGMHLEILGGGGLNVGGCGGRFAPPRTNDAGAPMTEVVPGGAGAGGTLLLEAPTLTLAKGAALVAHGGAGGWHRNPQIGVGDDGGWSAAPACPPDLSSLAQHSLRAGTGCGSVSGNAGQDGGHHGSNWIAAGGGSGYVVLRGMGSLAIPDGALVSPAPLLRPLDDAPTDAPIPAD